MRKVKTRLRQAYAELEPELQRPPNDREVADRLGMTVEELEEALADVGQSAVLSLDEIISSGGEIVVGPIDDSNDPAECAARSDQRRQLARAIDELPDRERTVIALYHYENLTQKEIAATLGVTESRVCQIHSKGVLRLAGKMSRASAGFALAA